MAILDPRLLPLIETLAAAGADWLAIEIVDSIGRGRETEELETSLALARELVRSGETNKRRSTQLQAPADPILGDDQIKWAERYVFERIEGALADLAQATALLQIVADTPPQQPGKTTNAGIGPYPPIKIATVDQKGQTDDRRSIETARAGLQKLEQALEYWSLDARGLTHT